MKFFEINKPGEKPIPFQLRDDQTEIYLGDRKEEDDESAVLSGKGPDVIVKKAHKGILINFAEKMRTEKRCLIYIRSLANYNYSYQDRIAEPKSIEPIMEGIFQNRGNHTISGSECIAIANPNASFKIADELSVYEYRWDGTKWFVLNQVKQNTLLGTHLIINPRQVQEGEKF